MFTTFAVLDSYEASVSDFTTVVPRTLESLYRTSSMNKLVCNDLELRCSKEICGGFQPMSSEAKV